MDTHVIIRLIILGQNTVSWKKKKIIINKIFKKYHYKTTDTSFLVLLGKSKIFYESKTISIRNKI